MVSGTSSALPSGLSAQFWSPWHDLPRGASGSAGGAVAESLGEGEAWIGGWDGVGLYEGNNKVPAYQNMTVHVTTHRLLLVPTPVVSPNSSSSPTAATLQAPLAAVRQTEFYAGFMRSSAKITLYLGRVPVPEAAASSSSTSALGGLSRPTSISAPATAPASAAASTTAVNATAADSWTCGVCGFPNPLLPGASVGPASKCQLCGVAYAMSKAMSPPPSRTATPVAPPEVTPVVPAPQPPKPATNEVACPACTFLNHADLTQCEICGTKLPKARPTSALALAPLAAASTASTAPPSPAPSSDRDRHDVVRLSFRRGGEKDAYKRLKGVLSDKVWERVAAGTTTRPRSSEDDAAANRAPAGAGIDAIMRNISLDAQAHDAGMTDAFRDLEILMVRAGEMVRLAQNLNAKLTAAGGSAATDSDATLVRSSLVRLGLPAPALTQDMVADEHAYLSGLARELGGLLTGSGKGKSRRGEDDGPLMLRVGHGVVALDTVWGLWMRARGVALLPPATLVSLLPLLPQHTDPVVRALTLPSGLSVLYAPLYAPGVLLGRLVRTLTANSLGGDTEDGDAAPEEAGMSIIAIAATEGLPIGLATEMVEMVAARPAVGAGGKTAMGLVRDDQAGPADGGVRWYRDIISGWPLGTMGVVA